MNGKRRREKNRKKKGRVRDLKEEEEEWKRNIIK